MNGNGSDREQKTYKVEHRANVPGVRVQPVIWESSPVQAASAGEALDAFFERPDGFKPHTEHEYLAVVEVSA